MSDPNNEIPVRVRNTMAVLGITLHELSMIGERKLLQQPNLGRHGINWLRENHPGGPSKGLAAFSNRELLTELLRRTQAAGTL